MLLFHIFFADKCVFHFAVGFELFQKGGKICIQFIHNQNITYTLKVLKNAMVTFEVSIALRGS